MKGWTEARPRDMAHPLTQQDLINQYIAQRRAERRSRLADTALIGALLIFWGLLIYSVGFLLIG